MNGHKNWNHWNVSLWLFNDYDVYQWIRSCVQETSTKDDAARRMMESLDGQETPDGAPYTYTSVRAALAHWEG
jgi:hypothetical protein|tara:strand:- start:461 stop:679 length:219 start_codon:yes stop_codon:yes gene_type:complete